MFLIIESDLSTFYCNDPPGDVGDGIDCDMNNDGANDIFDSSSRGWLNLNGTGDRTEIYDWIIDGFEGEIGIGYWIGNFTGVDNTSLGLIKQYIECTEPSSNWESCKKYFVPIWNHMCPNGPPSSECPAWWEPGDVEILRGGVGQNYYRIQAGAQVVITCSHISGDDKVGGHNSRCTFRNYLIEKYPDDWTSSLNFKTLEGFFIQGPVFTAGGDPNASDFGAYAVNLIK